MAQTFSSSNKFSGKTIVQLCLGTKLILNNNMIKGDDKKPRFLNFCFAHSSASINRIFNILVPTPHILSLIMWGRHKDFKDPMYRSWDMRNKIQNQGLFFHNVYHFELYDIILARAYGVPADSSRAVDCWQWCSGHYFHQSSLLHSLFFFSAVTFSHRRSARIKKLI